LVTGHTGFKGAWLSLWLKLLGAEVIGYSLPPSTTPSLFALTHLQDDLESITGDVRDFRHLQEVIQGCCPEIVMHLAAQALVRPSYRDPLETYATNVMGTVHLLEAVRQTRGVRAVINVTSDKCYENREWIWGYREIDPMGGFDPYASSKGCSEIVTAAYRRSFFHPADYGQHGVALASARAGNVIGGGDWNEDRLVPDIMRAHIEGRALEIRTPQACRPWQFVLEPLRGYLMLAEKLATVGPEYAEAWNFGPAEADVKPVLWLVEKLGEWCGPALTWQIDGRHHPHEAALLKLDSSKARIQLGWEPVMNLETGLEWTVSWYKAFKDNPSSVRAVTESQIISYQGLG
jgi:CDP-glucose 4,6-dehydratase